MHSVEYPKIDLKNNQAISLSIDLDFLMDEFSRWIVEYIAQQSSLIVES